MFEPREVQSGITYERNGTRRAAPAQLDEDNTAQDYKSFRRRLTSFLRSPSKTSSSRILAEAPVEERILDPAQLDIQVLSQPPGTTVQELDNSFWNFKYPGRGEVVYALDAGFDINHEETHNIAVDRILMTGSFPGDDGFTAVAPRAVDHGTAFAAKIAGPTIGIATNATLVLGRVVDGAGYWGIDTFLDLLLKVHADIREQDPKKGYIVTTSLNIQLEWPGFTKSYEYLVGIGNEAAKRFYLTAAKEAVEDVIDSIVGLPNTFFVCSGGDSTPVGYQKLWQDVLARKYGRNSRFIVTGGYNQYNGSSIFETSDSLAISAPAAYINVPARWKNGYVEERKQGDDQIPPTSFHRDHQLEFDSGLSFTAPAVSGIIATWLSIGLTPQDIVPLMHNLAHRRIKNGPKVLYNGVPIRRWPKSRWPAWYVDRRDDKQNLPPLPEVLDNRLPESLPVPSLPDRPSRQRRGFLTSSHKDSGYRNISDGLGL
ncbi:hypothetical protein TWF281_003749 [Arthrobotrys megalospora]